MWREKKILSMESLQLFPNSSDVLGQDTTYTLSLSHPRSESTNKGGREGERGHSVPLEGWAQGDPKCACSWRTSLREPRPKSCRSQVPH